MNRATLGMLAERELLIQGLLNTGQGSDSQWKPLLALKSENTQNTGSPCQWSHLHDTLMQGFPEAQLEVTATTMSLHTHRAINASPSLCLLSLHECLPLVGSKPEPCWPKEPGKCSFQPSSPDKTRNNLDSTDNIWHREMLLRSAYYWETEVPRSGLSLPKFPLLVCGGNEVWISLNLSASKIQKNEWNFYWCGDTNLSTWIPRGYFCAWVAVHPSTLPAWGREIRYLQWGFPLATQESIWCSVIVIRKSLKAIILKPEKINSSVIRGMQVKTTKRCFHICLPSNLKGWKGVKPYQLSDTAGGHENWYNHFEK